MIEYNEDIILLKRNVSALVEAVNVLNTRHQEDAKRVEALINTLTQQTQQIQTLQTQVALIRASTLGHGATT